MNAADHLKNIEHEIHTMDVHGHLDDFEILVQINAIEHHIYEVRKKIENGSNNNRGSDRSDTGG